MTDKRIDDTKRLSTSSSAGGGRKKPISPVNSSSTKCSVANAESPTSNNSVQHSLGLLGSPAILAMMQVAAAGLTPCSSGSNQQSSKFNIVPVLQEFVQNINKVSAAGSSSVSASATSLSNNFPNLMKNDKDVSASGSTATTSSLAGANINSGGGRDLGMDVCVVCGDKASGRHYGAVSCEGCKGFFKRSIRKKIGYVCRGSKDCPVTKFHRNRCQYCRLKKCLSMGMRSESVQAERRPTGAASPTNNNAASTKAFSTQDDAAVGSKSTNFDSQGGVMAGLLAFSQNWEDDNKLSILSSKSNNKRNNNSDEMFDDAYSSALAIADEMPIKSPMGESAPEDESADESLEESQSPDERPLFDLLMSTSRHDSASSFFNNFSTNGNNGVNHNNHNGNNGPDQRLLTLEKATFELPSPLPMPPVLNMQYICETASRLLFLSVHWLKNVSILNLYPSTTQEAILKQRWCEVFVLGLLQCSGQFCLNSMLTAMATHLHTCALLGQLKMERYEEVQEQITSLQAFLQRCEELKLDSMEYGYLKLAAFTAIDSPTIGNSSDFKALQIQACQELKEYLLAERSNDFDADSRLISLLLLLPTLRSFSKQILVELFFSGLIGNVQVENVIPFILKMDVLQIFGGNQSANALASIL